MTDATKNAFNAMLHDSERDPVARGGAAEVAEITLQSTATSDATNMTRVVVERAYSSTRTVQMSFGGVDQILNQMDLTDSIYDGVIP